MKAIQKELGDADDRTQEIDALRDKIEAAGMTEEAKKEALRELDRLAKMPPAAAEYTVARTYIDWLVSMPWQQATADNVDIGAARTILDEDHEGLEKIKERILEYLAVKKIAPPARIRSSASWVLQAWARRRSAGRLPARSAEVPSHLARRHAGRGRDPRPSPDLYRRLAGQIIQGLRRAGTRNPVFMLDEIDKLGMDFRGDPASALLEVLDPEQNVSFRDHYLDVAFDLSRVLFVTTANVIDTVPPALRDRMEIIPLAGYTEEEKIAIAQRHLVPKEAREHGLDPGKDIEFTPEALRLLARGYTRESGVRNLEREIASVCRKVARRRAEGQTDLARITPDVVTTFLRRAALRARGGRGAHARPGRRDRPGVDAGWRDVLVIEATRMQGKRTLTLTGQLGDVMKESSRRPSRGSGRTPMSSASARNSGRHRTSTCTFRPARFRRTGPRRASR